MLAGLFQFQRLGDFIQLELDQGRIFIATRVVFGQDTPGFFFLLIGHEPPRRLWDPEDKSSLKGRYGLLE